LVLYTEQHRTDAADAMIELVLNLALATLDSMFTPSALLAVLLVEALYH
jgi:hypothetical protein